LTFQTKEALTRVTLIAPELRQPSQFLLLIVRANIVSRMLSVTRPFRDSRKTTSFLPQSCRRRHLLRGSGEVQRGACPMPNGQKGRVQGMESFIGWTRTNRTRIFRHKDGRYGFRGRNGPRMGRERVIYLSSKDWDESYLRKLKKLKIRPSDGA
jgi:hypothetical protein